MSITLAQFEQIDGLLNAVQRRPALEEINGGVGVVRELYFRPEWKLFDKLVEVFGYEASNDYPSAEAWGADVVTHALMSSTFVGE